jgi:alkanesulfonate monooxygenase SsuD/methylene tetrahydromethanopterin reductase-like flavin-dependent oxidoreductase (luciferase family)
VSSRGVALFAGTPGDVVAETALLVEQGGYRSFWLNHPGRTDGIAGLAPAAAATSRLELGVGVVPLHVRSASSVVVGVREQELPLARLLLGIGSSGPGAFRLARAGVAAIHEALGCRVVMGALAEPACRLAGEIADGVLLNWLTPEHARRSTAWVEAGAAKAGRERPRVYAYVRVALGAGARERIETEGARYASGSYRTHFERMGVAPLETAIAASVPGEVTGSLDAWEGAVDEIVLRLLPAAETAEAHLELVRAGAPDRL